MVYRKCPKCQAIFDRKSNYDKHINKKFDCSQNIKKTNKTTVIIQNIPIQFQNIPQNSKKKENINQNISNELIHQTCGFCFKSYSNKGNLTKHLKTCRVKKEKDDEKENIFKLLLEKDKKKDKEIKELKEQNKLLMKKIDNLINLNSSSKHPITNNQSITNNQLITNNDNSVTNNQNNFIMVNFGKEDLSIIDEKIFIDRIIKKPSISGVRIPDEVLKIIHFNPLYPQLSNIYISDINREKCMVFEDNEWKLSNIDNIPQIMDKVCIFSSEQINALKTKHPNNKVLQDRLGVIEKYNNMIDNVHIEDLKDDENNDNSKLIARCEEFQKMTYNTFKNTLYNEGKKIKIKKNVKCK